MPRNDRSPIAIVLERVRRLALDIETKTSIIPWPAEAEENPAEQRMLLYDRVVTDGALRQATRKLFLDEHYADAVGKAYLVVNNTVKHRTKTTHDGVDLMNHA